MSKNDIINTCRELFDSLTISKGYLQLNEYKHNGNHYPILQHLSEMENKFRDIVDGIDESD